MLLAEGLIYDYPDLTIRLRLGPQALRRVGGADFIVKDSATSQKMFDRKRAAIRDSGAQVAATSSRPA